MSMASVVKRLRPRIVVPICMGSNPIRRPIFEALLMESFLMRMMRMRSHQGEAFKVVRARGGRGRSVLRKCETQKQNTQTRLTPPSKTIPSDAPFLRALLLESFFDAHDENELVGWGFYPNRNLLNTKAE